MKKQTEEELRRIIETVMSKNRINEALGGSSADMSSIDKLKSKYPNGFKMMTVTASGSATFANGIDTVDDNNPQIKNIINNILAACGYASYGDGRDIGCSRKISVTIDGGASAVGSESGFDNKSLAERRRDNLINLLKKVNLIPKEVSKGMIKIIKGNAIIGTATVKNSPQAQKEQFVRAKITSESNIPVKGVEGDNTNVAIGKYKQKGKGKDLFDTTVKYKRVCVKIPVGLVDEFKKKIREYKAENGGMAVPFGVYDIKK